MVNLDCLPRAGVRCQRSKKLTNSWTNKLLDSYEPLNHPCVEIPCGCADTEVINAGKKRNIVARQDRTLL